MNLPDIELCCHGFSVRFRFNETQPTSDCLYLQIVICFSYDNPSEDIRARETWVSKNDVLRLAAFLETELQVIDARVESDFPTFVTLNYGFEFVLKYLSSIMEGETEVPAAVLEMMVVVSHLADGARVFAGVKGDCSVSSLRHFIDDLRKVTP